MAESKGESPPNQDHALAVGFIENELPRYHAYFENPPTTYDKQAARFVDIKPTEVLGMTHPTPAALPAPSPAPVYHATGLTRPAPGPRHSTNPEENAHKTMECWSMIFPSAMKEFLSMAVKAPKHRKLEYDIRNDRSWIDVYDKLESARRYYTDQTGISGGFRRVWRWTADNTTGPVRIAAKVVPQTDIVTPVLGAVQIILEAVEKGAEVRKEALDAFEELPDIFSDVELYLGTFYKEGRILEPAVSLVASVLLATERGIVFFTRNGCKCEV